MIAAVEKAERLYKYARAQGAKLDTFCLALSTAEALEALDWLGDQMWHGEPDPLFTEDLAFARRTNNPWAMMANFSLMGFAVIPVQVLN